jgi:hypothetical protein
VANLGVLGWVLKAQKESFMISVVKKFWGERGGSLFFYSFCFFIFNI